MQAEQLQTPFTMQDGYRSNAYLTISVRDKMRITCEALKAMSTTELSKLWKVSLSAHHLSLLHDMQAVYGPLFMYILL